MRPAHVDYVRKVRSYVWGKIGAEVWITYQGVRGGVSELGRVGLGWGLGSFGCVLWGWLERMEEIRSNFR